MSQVLTLNAGSSTLKFAVFEAGPEPRELLTGLIDQIGGTATVKIKDAEGQTLCASKLTEETSKNHEGALKEALSEILALLPDATIDAVGHRVVHGGMDFSDPVEVTQPVLDQLEKLVSLAPLHQPHNLSGIRAARSAFPNARQVACFDTGFHRGHPFVHDTFALPRSYYDKGIRRYGFHGLSYDYISGQLARVAPDLHQGRVIVAHLGNGASLCGMLEGRSITSTMGFSALDGLAMGTRPGQLDPGVLLYLMDHEGLDASQISDLLYKQSGLLGLSGISNDMRTLLESTAPEAQEAVDYFCMRIQREIGSLTAALGGLDALIFTGGIGENAAPIRQQVCDKLGWLGVRTDPQKNSTGAETISTSDSSVRVMILATNEEAVIAKAAAVPTC